MTKCHVLTDLSGGLLGISREDCKPEGSDAPTHTIIRPGPGQRLYRLEVDPKILELAPEEIFEALHVEDLGHPRLVVRTKKTARGKRAE